MRRKLLSVGNRMGVWLYRATNGGRLSGNTDKVHVLLVTSPGRRTGRLRSTCVRYLDHEGGFLVWGTGSGSRTDPDWFRNLRATLTAQVQVGSKQFNVRSRELLGEERDQVWSGVVLAEAPGIAKYEKKAGRTIPVAHLTPAQP